MCDYVYVRMPRGWQVWDGLYGWGALESRSEEAIHDEG